MNQMCCPLSHERQSRYQGPMQLTRHTDYALRLLIDLARQDGERMSIATVAQAQAISRTHLMKIANQLAHAGFIEAARGRNGGIRLSRKPEEINIGAVIAAMVPIGGPLPFARRIGRSLARL